MSGGDPKKDELTEPPDREDIESEHLEGIYCDVCNQWLNGPVEYECHIYCKKHVTTLKAQKRAQRANPQGG